MEKIETAIEPKFEEYFIEAMAIPHKADPYEELAKVVPLPAPYLVIASRAQPMSAANALAAAKQSFKGIRRERA